MNDLKSFSTMGPDDNSWRTQAFRQSVVGKIEEAIQRSGMQVARNSSEMENHVFLKAKTREEYMNMVAKLILHVRETFQSKPNQGAPNMAVGNQNQPGPNQQVQQQSGPPSQSNQSGLAPDPINALQNLASQGSRNQMMSMGGQSQMQQQGGMGNPGMTGMQVQMGPVSQGGPQAQTATNLLQTLNQRPQLNMQLQNKLGAPMGMGNQGQMGANMVGGISGMGNPMSSQLQSQLASAGMQGQMGGAGMQGQMGGAGMQGQMGVGGMQGQMGGGGMQGQMMSNMSMQNSMQVPMSGTNNMGQMPCNQVVGGMGGQMAPNSMQAQMGGMSNNPMVGMNMLQHMQGRVQNKEVVGGMIGGGYAARAPPPNQFLRQSPSPSAPSPSMGPGPSPASMNVMGSAMSSPLSMGPMGGCGGTGGVGSPSLAASPSAPHLHHSHHTQQRSVSMGMVASPSSSLSTPGGGCAGSASPVAEEAAYRDKVRQLSKYIEPLRRMVLRMVSEGENVEKLTKMKNLLDILSNPNKRMPLETLIKCEVVLEKLDFKRSEGFGLGIQVPSSGKEQIFNPLLEVVNNCLQFPLANHTLKRTFGSTLDALNGPEIKNLPPPQKIVKIEEATPDIPDVLQGEIARLDSRFKVSLETMQLAGGTGAISLIAQLDDARLPCVPAVQVSVPRDYPATAPARLRPKHANMHLPPDSFLARLERAMDARCARLPKGCSVGQLLDAWEMSVRQACAPSSINYTPVPALGL